VHRGRAHSEQAAPAPLPALRSPTPAPLHCAYWVRTPRAALSPADHASAAEKLARNGSRLALAYLLFGMVKGVGDGLVTGGGLVGLGWRWSYDGEAILVGLGVE